VGSAASVTGNAGSNSKGGMSVMCCQEEFSVTGRSLVQRSLAECGVSECDRDA
jgi:hypothetical protein